MSSKEEPAQVLTRDIRGRLKQIALQELEQLPDLLAKMEPKERVQYTLKLLSYVAPKVGEIDMYDGEPMQP